MRKFTKEEARFVFVNSNKMSLEELATILDCEPEDIYNLYTYLLTTEGYKKFSDKRKRYYFNLLGGSKNDSQRRVEPILAQGEKSRTNITRL